MPCHAEDTLNDVSYPMIFWSVKRFIHRNAQPFLRMIKLHFGQFTDRLGCESTAHQTGDVFDMQLVAYPGGFLSILDKLSQEGQGIDQKSDGRARSPFESAVLLRVGAEEASTITLPADFLILPLN